MGFLPYNTLIVMLGTSLLGVLSGLVGSFAVLRRRALTGDALAHAALPGLCIAFLIMQERNLIGLLIGALASGILGVLVVSGLQRLTRIKEDAAIGIVLSVFYGAGIVLISIIQQPSDKATGALAWLVKGAADGEAATGGSKAGLMHYVYGQTAGMIRADVYLIAGVCAVCLLLVALLYKEFKLVSFDPGFAETQGWPVLAIDLGLMVMVAVTVVIGLPAVGAIMMAAMLIIPAAAARFWTNRLSLMLLLSGIFGGLTGMIGTLVTNQFGELPAGPIIVLVGVVIFLLSMLFAPARGVIASGLRLREFRQRVAHQRVLVELVGTQGLTLEELTPRRSWTQSRLTTSLAALQSDGLLQLSGPTYKLTKAGEKEAKEAARGVDLWKRFLVRNPQLAANFTDLDARRIDEILPADVLQELEAERAANRPGGVSNG